MGKIIKNKISYAGGGAEGKSAYQTWLDLGNTGTEQDFLDSLGGSASINDNDISLDSTWSSAKIVTEMSDNYAIFEGVIGDNYYSTTIDEEDITNVPSSLYGGWTLDKVNTNFTEGSILSTFYNATSKKAISLTEDVRIGEVYTDSFSVYDDTMNNGGNPYKVALLWNNNVSGDENIKIYTSLAELGLTADATVEDVVNALKNGESFLAPVNTFTNYETIFPNKVPSDQWNKIHIVKGTSLPNSHIRCFSQSGACEYLANVNNTNVVGWNDVSGTYIDISDSIIEKLGNEILKYPVGKYRINSTTTGNKFIDLPSDAETKCGLIEVNGTAVGKSPFTDTWVYRMYKFECLTGTSSYVRRLNSGATVGQIELDTGWCVKQNIYTSLEELGLTAPTTVGEVFMAMPEKSMLMLNVEALVDDGTNVLTVTDVPKEFGVLTIEKHIYGRFRIEYSNSLGGAVFNARKWIGALKGSDGTGLVWKEVNTGNHKYTTMAELALDGSTATIQDVIDKVAIGDSVMMRTDAFNNNNWQTQCNGIQWGYLKIEKTQNGLSNIELQEVITPNRRYFGAQSSGKFAGWVATTGTKGLVTNAQNFKLDITKNHASWYGFFKLEYLYGTELCQVDVGIANTIDYRVTKGRNHIDKITHTVNGANIVLGIDFISKVYGVQVVEMPSEFGTINNLTAEQFTGDTAATYVDSSNEIIHTNLSGNLAGITTVLDLVNALLTEYRATSPKKPIRFVSGEFTKTTLTDLPVAYGLLQITVAGWDVIEVRLAHSANGFKTMYYGFVNRISGEESISSITWRMVETKSIYNSVAELNKAKGTSIELINGEDNTQKIVDALSVGEQFISLYHNNANQNRFGIDVSYGNLINEIRITKCLDADLTANYATVTAFMNTGVTMSRIYYKTYSTDWCVNGTIKYSTGEVAIGTWIDGSTIYRTVVEFNSVEAKTSESEVQVATNIPVATPQKVIRMEGFVNLIGNQFYIHYPNITCNDDTIKATVNIVNGNVKLKGTWKYPIGKGALILEYIK